MSPTEFWIRNATLATGDGPRDADVRVAGETVAEVRDRPAGSEASPADASSADIDARGLWLMPGGVDVHTHFGMPLAGGVRSLGWSASSAAALLGGTTTIIDFANPARGEPIAAAVARWKEAAGRCLCDWSLHATVSDAAAERLAEIPGLVADGLPTFKAFLAYKDRLMLTPAELEDLMRAVRAAGGRLLLHAEMGELNASCEAALLHTGRTGPQWHPAAHPADSEVEAVRLALGLARRTGCPLSVVHVSTAGALADIAAARAEGLDVTAEACIHHLYRDESEYARGYDQALAAVLSPPLRPATDAAALRDGLASGTVSHIATDHCAFPLEIKRRAAAAGGFVAVPNGAGGVGARLLVVYTESVVPGAIPPCAWVRLCCEAPADLMGLGGRKGRIAPGWDADLVLFDPDADRTSLPVAGDGSLWKGANWQGAVRDVWRRGESAVRKGKLIDDIQPGRRIPRQFTL